MALLTAADLASMQATAQGVLDQTCTITRAATTTDTWGSPGSGTPAQIGGTVPCGLGKPSAKMLAPFAAKLIGQVAYDAFFSVGTDIKPGDELTIGSRTLKVEAIPDLESFLILLHVLAVEVR